MYQLLNLTTGEVTIVDKPRYVKKNDNGIWIRCEESEAQCISIFGERFSIANKKKVRDAPQVVAVSQIDGAQKLAQISVESIQNAQNLDEVKAAVQDLLWAVADIYDNGLN